jgi:hypothetical protein
VAKGQQQWGGGGREGSSSNKPVMQVYLRKDTHTLGDGAWHRSCKEKIMNSQKNVKHPSSIAICIISPHYVSML